MARSFPLIFGSLSVFLLVSLAVAPGPALAGGPQLVTMEISGMT